MSQLSKKSTFLGKLFVAGLLRLLLIITLSSCQKLKPESVDIPEYPDFKVLMTSQIEALSSKNIKKEVSLDENHELLVLEMGSAKWTEELSFLEEVNPNQPEYVGAFEKETDGGKQTLTLKEGEKGPLKKVTYEKSENSFKSIRISFHEDKDVYIHHREIAMNFTAGILSSLQIDGYQKMMFKDTVRFGIEIEVN